MKWVNLKGKWLSIGLSIDGQKVYVNGKFIALLKDL